MFIKYMLDACDIERYNEPQLLIVDASDINKMSPDRCLCFFRMGSILFGWDLSHPRRGNNRELQSSARRVQSGKLARHFGFSTHSRVPIRG